MTIDDKEIMNQMKRDAERGCRLLMEKYGEPIYWHLRRLLTSHEDAQDAAQETFIRVFRAIDKVKDDSKLKAWIYRIATNEALRIIEKRKGDTQMLLNGDNISLFSDGMVDSYVDYTDLEAVKLQRAIQSLPPKQQLAFNMRYYDEMSYEDIAEAAGTSVSTAKVNYHLAKEKIIKFMESND